jgi:hypothetical protein
LSEVLQAIWLPSGEKAIDQTSQVRILRGPKGQSPEVTPQIRLIPSAEPDATCLPSDEKAAHRTKVV